MQDRERANNPYNSFSNCRKAIRSPVLNSPYDYLGRHWELDEAGQPTQRIIEARRIADFITPIPKAKKKKSRNTQSELVLDEGAGLSSEEQQYTASNINSLREHVNRWRRLHGQ